ncbi:MAG: SurA N-terminal domain-containing protein, partial [Anaerolineae bacterium]
MSKRSTTGLPKPDQPKPETESRNRLQPRLLREYRSKHERETEMQRLILIGTIITVSIALIILLGAILNEQLFVPNQTVASVNGHNISVNQFKSRAKIERALLIQQLDSAISLYSSIGYTSDQLAQLISSQQPYSTWYAQLQVADQLGNSVLNTMVEDELVRQKAAELGITVSEAEVDANIAKSFGFDAATA